MVKVWSIVALWLGVAMIAAGVGYMVANLTWLQALQVCALVAVCGVACSRAAIMRAIAARLEKPDELVGPPKKPQIRRWFLFRSKWVQIVLHHHLRSDPPVMHDHSWRNWTYVLKGSGTEWRKPSAETMAHLAASQKEIRTTLPAGVNVRFEDAVEGVDLRPGVVIKREPTDLHWYQLDEGCELWTIFITGREVREWGHVIDGKWRAWWKCENLDRLRID